MSNLYIDDVVNHKLCHNCLNHGALKIYDSDQDVDKYHCSICGATTEVGYERVPTSIDVVTDYDQDIRKNIWRF